MPAASSRSFKARKLGSEAYPLDADSIKGVACSGAQSTLVDNASNLSSGVLVEQRKHALAFAMGCIGVRPHSREVGGKREDAFALVVVDDESRVPSGTPTLSANTSRASEGCVRCKTEHEASKFHAVAPPLRATIDAAGMGHHVREQRYLRLPTAPIR